MSHCREAELLPAVYDRLESGDWRERLKGLEEVCNTYITRILLALTLSERLCLAPCFGSVEMAWRSHG